MNLSADQAAPLARLGFVGPQTPSVGASDLSLGELYFHYNVKLNKSVKN